MKTVVKPLLPVVAGIVLALQAGLGAAQTEEGAGDQITLNFQDVDIRALINTVSEITGRNFIVDPRVKGQVTVVSGGPLNADQIYEVFLSVLQVHNFSAVPSGDVTKIIPNNIVKQEPTPTAYGETGNGGEAQITQVYKLKHASVQELVPILRPLLPPTSHFAAHAPSNTLVFTDTRANVRRILDIIARMDLPDRRSNVRVVFLDHARASDLVTVLSQLAGNFNIPQGEGGQRSRQVSVQADEATNSLIINAPDSEYQLLQAVVDQLDVERPTQKDIHVMYLEYAKATDLVDILNQVSEGLIETEGEEAPDRRITVQADASANALVIHARPKEFQSIETVVKQLDVKRKQVFVEAIIAEVSFNKAADLGIEWRATSNDVTSGGEVTGSTEFTDISGGLTLGFINQFMVNATGGVVPDLEIILRALRSDSHTNILSTPNLLTLNNEEAEIVVGQEVPFVTGQFTTPVAGGDQAGDGVNPFQTIERRDVGLSLKITPQINAGETITMEVEQEISNVSETTVQGASDLITDERRITATVQVDSGQIVVIGGLIRDDVLDTVEWVPVLGRIPIIGELFKRKQKSAVKTNLMVFLRPRIVEDGANLAEATRKKYEYMRELSKESQPGTRNMIRQRKPPVLPEVRDWQNPDEDLEPEVIPEEPKMFP